MKQNGLKSLIFVLLVMLIGACSGENDFLLEHSVTRSVVTSNGNDSTEYETRVIYDSNLRYVLTDYRWNKKTLNYYFLNNSSQMAAYTAREAVREAFNVWSKSLDVSFYEVSSKSNADIEIGWFSDSPHDNNCSFKPDAVAHTVTTYNKNTNIVVKQQLHFNENYFFDTTGDTYDLMSVALHEIGHVLCIGHSSDYSAVMYPIYRYVQRSLSKDDWNAGWRLYSYSGKYYVKGSKTFENNTAFTVSGLPSGFSIDHWTVSCEYSNTFHSMETKMDKREFSEQTLSLTNWYSNYRLQVYTLNAIIRNDEFGVILSENPISFITYNCYPSAVYGILNCVTQSQNLVIEASSPSYEKLDFGTDDSLNALLVYLENNNGPLCYSSVNQNFKFLINGRTYDYGGNVELYKTDVDEYGYINVDVYFGARGERFSIPVQ